ncbi:TIGR02444 family protein [Asticcacaulis sp. AND118]|uniref:TIGR02444 family protein n=1 Tax=Asticcacaulis sp. AND118 TaxID=2840468 RepID=UPI001CFFA5D6|nr:TIGR02444 family protein [Asticcacaulis sp. AND118]UDF02867.1 TIGR02444 family protein [Asticcacaulis sp. AND118]
MSDFWDWAVAAYGGEGVADRCLELQDTHGQNVPLVLFAVWAGVRGVALDEETAEAAVDISRAYADTVVVPLRTIRQRMRAVVGDMDDAHREALRTRVKALEIEAERAQMEALSALVGTGAAEPQKTARDNLIAVAKLWARVVPRNPLIAFCDALSERGFLRYNT